MNAPTLIPAKVRRIMPTLGSSIDGEALGACRAIGRILDGASLSFHDLAHAIRVEELEPDPVAIFHGIDPDPAGWRSAWSQNRQRSAYTPRQEREHREQALYCRDHDGGRLSDRERLFVLSIANWRGGLSVRQGDWLTDICARLEAEDRAA